MSAAARASTDAWVAAALVAGGAVCVAWSVTAWVQAATFQHLARAALTALAPRHDAPAAAPDATSGPAVGLLEIPRLGLSVVVARGDDEATLRVAAGHLPETALPWEVGNTAIAGHRDTFFRPLQHVRSGDTVVLTTPRGQFRYRVRETVVVDPSDVWVIGPTPHPSLTLITCYPFRHVGPAPQRFIVRADRLDAPDGVPAAPVG